MADDTEARACGDAYEPPAVRSLGKLEDLTGQPDTSSIVFDDA